MSSELRSEHHELDRRPNGGAIGPNGRLPNERSLDAMTVEKSQSARRFTMEAQWLQLSDELGPEKVILITEPSTGLRGILVVDNTAAGPAIGGIRMALDVTVDEVFRLARAMTFKNAAAGLRHGGGKAGIIGDPDMPNDEKERLVRAFGIAIRDIVDYIPGPDMGIDEACMAYLYDEIGRVVGLPKVMGGIPLALGIWGEATDRPWQTMIFTTLALLQLAHALAVRSEMDSLFTLGFTTNRALLATIVGTAVLQVGMLYWGVTQTLLTIEALDLFELALVLVASTGVFWAVEAEKWFRRRAVHR